MMDWYCEKLHCLMSRSACQKRRELANDKLLRTDGNQYRNAGCGTCTQTEANMEPIENDLSNTQKVCKICGKTKNTSEFALNARSSDGMEHKCKDCRKKPDTPCRGDRPVALVQNENNMVFDPQEDDRPVSPTIPDPQMTRAYDDLDIDATISAARDDRIIIAIDFSDYPDLHSALQLHAYSEMRTPEMQAAYMLRELLVDIKPSIDKKWGEWA